MKRLACLALLPLLGACQSTGSGPAPGAIGPDVPAAYRQRLATTLADAYVADGSGPAQISRAMRTRSSLLGPRTTFRVRYPVQVNRRVQELPRYAWMFEGRGRADAGMRCFIVTLADGDAAAGRSGFHLERPKVDPERCGDDEEWAAYAELDATGRRLRDCKAGGAPTCLISAQGMSEAQARRLIESTTAPRPGPAAP